MHILKYILMICFEFFLLVLKYLKLGGLIFFSRQIKVSIMPKFETWSKEMNTDSLWISMIYEQKTKKEQTSEFKNTCSQNSSSRETPMLEFIFSKVSERLSWTVTSVFSNLLTTTFGSSRLSRKNKYNVTHTKTYILSSFPLDKQHKLNVSKMFTRST